MSASDTKHAERERELDREIEKYRGAAWMALEQLQWAIGYLRWSGMAGARHTTAVLDRNRDHIARSIR